MGEVKERQKAAFFRSWLLEGILGFLSKKTTYLLTRTSGNRPIFRWEQSNPRLTARVNPSWTKPILLFQ
jgi:hypothetical protein